MLNWNDITVVVRSRSSEQAMAEAVQAEVAQLLPAITTINPAIIYSDDKKQSIIDCLEYGASEAREWLLVVENDLILSNQVAAIPSLLESKPNAKLVSFFSIKDDDLDAIYQDTLEQSTEQSTPFLISLVERTRYLRVNNLATPNIYSGVLYAIHCDLYQHFIAGLRATNQWVATEYPVSYLYRLTYNYQQQSEQIYYCVPSIVQHAGRDMLSSSFNRLP